MSSEEVEPLLSPSGPIVRAEELAIWTEAEAALTAARSHAAWLERTARAACVEHRRTAWREGYESGSIEVAELLARARAETDRHFEELARDVPRLVADMVEDLVGERMAPALIERSVRSVLAGRDEGEALTLKVPPTCLAPVEARLADLAASRDGNSSLAIVADPALPDDVAVLWGGRSSVEIGVATQLERLREALVGAMEGQ